VYHRDRLVHWWVAEMLLNVQSESLHFAPRFSLDLHKDQFVVSINKENTGISLFFSFKQTLFLVKQFTYLE